jgi:hypothetical protein
MLINNNITNNGHPIKDYKIIDALTPGTKIVDFLLPI